MRRNTMLVEVPSWSQELYEWQDILNSKIHFAKFLKAFSQILGLSAVDETGLDVVTYGWNLGHIDDSWASSIH